MGEAVVGGVSAGGGGLPPGGDSAAASVVAEEEEGDFEVEEEAVGTITIATTSIDYDE